MLGEGAEGRDPPGEDWCGGAPRMLAFDPGAERVWRVARVREGEGSPQAKAWADANLQARKEGEVNEGRRAIRSWKRAEAEAEQSRAEAMRYRTHHREGMAYEEYRADGLAIGSGAGEGTCKHLVTPRCNQAGMRWTEPGREALLALRCWVLNERLDQLRPKPKVKIDWEWAA